MDKNILLLHKRFLPFIVICLYAVGKMPHGNDEKKVREKSVQDFEVPERDSKAGLQPL